MKPSQGPRAVVVRIDVVCDERSVEPTIESGARVLDELRIECEELERPGSLATQVAVHLAGLSEA
jgi:hypothetical protein